MGDRARQRELGGGGGGGGGGGVGMKMNAPHPLSHFIRPRRVVEEPRGQFRYNSEILRNLDSPANKKKKNTNLIYADKINKNKNKK